ncbi:MAG: response regulator [Thermodesulfobacteriota bacterium]
MSGVKQPLFKSSLARRLTLYIVGSAVFIALVVGSSLIYLQTQTLYDNQCQSMSAINQRIAEVVREVIRDSQSLLYMAVQDDCFQEMNIPRIKNYFTRAMQRFPDFICFRLLNKNGHEILLAGTCPHSYPLGEGPFKKQVITAMQNGDAESYIGPVFVKQGRPMTDIVATIHNDKGLVGMIYTTLDITKYSTLLSTVKIGGGEGYAYLVDKKGYVIAHSDFRHVLKREKWSEVASVKHIMSGIDHAHNFKSDRYRAWDGRKVIGVHARIQPMGWGVIVEQPLASIYAPIKRTVVKTILWLLAAIGILIALTLYLSRRITRPILTLKEGTQEFANGNWEVFFDFKTGDEIQSLGEAFNSMAATLKNLYGKLHQEIKRVSLSGEALLESEEKYRGIFENAAEGISRSTLDAKFIMANPALITMLGYDSLEELLPLNIRKDVYVSAADRDRFIRLLIEHSSVKNFETTFKKKDGATIWVSLNAHALKNEDGEVIGSECITSDITTRKKAEESRYELEEFNTRMVHAIPSFICVIEPDFRLSFVSDHAGQFFNRPVEEMLGKRGLCHFGCVYRKGRECGDRPDCYRCRTHPACRNCPLRLALMALFTRGEETVRKEMSLKMEINGEETEKTILFTVLSLQRGEKETALLIMDDITRYKKLETQFFQAQKMESIGLLAGGVAHDFNNLLTGITGYASLLLNKLDKDRPEYTYVANIDQAGGRAAELIQQLLTFGRKVPTNPKPFQLNSLIEETRNLLLRTIPKSIAIESCLDPGLSIAEADPVQIQQVVMNICINARDAMPNGGRLIIETTNTGLDETYCNNHHGVLPGRYICIAISDTGIGMSREITERIFEPFFTTKGLGKGTGLGLSVAYAIVKNHRGFINVYSEVGRGTMFKIYLPAGGETRQEMEEKIKNLPTGDETVLIIDDEPLVLSVAQNILEDFGYKVIPVPDPREALTMYQNRQQDIDLVILDLIMPQMGGMECLDKLLGINSEVRVILTSGYSLNGHGKEATRPELKGFIRKPFQVAEFLTAVRKALDA